MLSHSDIPFSIPNSKLHAVIFSKSHPLSGPAPTLTRYVPAYHIFTMKAKAGLDPFPGCLEYGQHKENGGSTSATHS